MSAELEESAVKPDDPEVHHLKQKIFERYTDPAKIVQFLNATLKLSDADFERAYYEGGYRLAVVSQGRGALTGDKRMVDACETFIRRAKDMLAQTRLKPIDEPANAQFVQSPRVVKGSTGSSEK